MDHGKHAKAFLIIANPFVYKYFMAIPPH
jgi:hypothetical protein